MLIFLMFYTAALEISYGYTNYSASFKQTSSILAIRLQLQNFILNYATNSEGLLEFKLM